MKKMAICYKNFDGQSYLYRISNMSEADTLKRVDELNANKPMRDGPDDLSHVEYFFATEVNVW